MNDLESESGSEDGDVITKDQIIALYKTPGHPVAFSSPGTIYRFFNGQVSESFIREALESIDSYNLHREYKKPRTYNTHYVYRRRKQFQADLIDIASLKEENDMVTFLLVVIDVFSRKLWVVPLRRKTAEATKDGLLVWLNSMPNDKPESFLSDSGKEFTNRLVLNLMRERNIRMVQSKNIHKAAIAERVNKSIQVLIYKYLTNHGVVRYIDVLPEIVSTYNNRKHRSLDYMTPNEADKIKNQMKVRSIHIMKYGKLATIKKKRIMRGRKNKFKIGDTVRIKTYAQAPSSARRAYLQQFHGELFTISDINSRLPITMYEIKSMDTEETVSGGFYANELTRIRGDTFKIERIIRTRGKGVRKEYLVRWKYFGPQWDSWVKAEDMVNIQP